MSRTRSVVVGLGESGLAAARFLSARGEDVLVIDSRREPPALGELQTGLPDVRVELETLDPKWLESADRIVLSPGLPVDLPIVREAQARGLEVVGELELFARVVPAPVVAVTGSNGKSTVVTLATRMLEARGLNALSGGNLGPPALDLLGQPVPDVYVLEVSSFQLETTQSLRPQVAAVLNVSADHIDRHGTLDAYAAVKAGLLSNADIAIYNADDEIVSRMAHRHAHGIPFSVARPLDRGWSIVTAADGARWLARDLVPLMPSAELAFGGTVGEANSLAALALTESFGGRADAALDVLRRFEGLPHRLQHVATRLGVDYVDDSKGTNVGAACAAIASIDGPVVLVAGGRGKGADFGPLAGAAEGRVRLAIVIGEAASAIEAALAPVVPVERAATLEAAVGLAASRARPGDTVLLSPACASQDMFRDYRERGERFAQAVRGIVQ